MDNYPPGTSASDPHAPWNAPDNEREHEMAVAHICGADIILTTETLCEFLGELTEKREPLLTKDSVLRGPCSTGELLSLLLDPKTSDAYTAAAAREFSARYLANGYTQTVISDRIEWIAEAST